MFFGVNIFTLYPKKHKKKGMKTLLTDYSPMEISKMTGIGYSDVWRHLHGERRISAEMAMKYHKTLHIPLWKMRPDLWPAPEGEKEAENEAERLRQG